MGRQSFPLLFVIVSIVLLTGNHVQAGLPHSRGRQSFMLAKGGPAMSFKLATSSFSNGGEIPKKFTCSGADVSPELAWSEAPAGTKSFALIADDPDAPGGTYTHWVVYDLPANKASLPENVAKTDEISGGGKQGRNDFRKIGYGGPCPPPGKAHRYFFRLNALDKMLNLSAGAGRQDVEQAMKGHVLGEAEVMGRFAR